MTLQKNLFTIFFITGLGSSLSSIASFLSIGSFFSNIFYISIALSLKTLAAAIFSYKAKSLINKFGVRKSYILSQVFGCFAVAVIAYGFWMHNFLIVVIGIMFSSIPGALISILLTFTLKTIASNNSQFRKDSGRRESIAGLSFFIAALLSPLLLIKLNIYMVLALDVLSFIVGTLLLQRVSFVSAAINSSDPEVLEYRIYKSKETWIFMIQMFSSLLLVSIVPIFASSSDIQFTKYLPTIIRQWIWGVDALMLVLASLIYLIAKNIKTYPTLEFIVLCNGSLLLLLLTNMHSITLVVLLGISLFSTISFLQLRDDYILSAGDNKQLIASYSGLSMLQKNLVYFLSPLILSTLFNKFNISTIIAIVVSLQIFAYIVCYFLKKPSLIYNP